MKSEKFGDERKEGKEDEDIVVYIEDNGVDWELVVNDE